MVIRNYCVCIFIPRRILSYSYIQFYLYLTSKLWYFMFRASQKNLFILFLSCYHFEKFTKKLLVIKKVHLSKNGSSSSNPFHSFISYHWKIYSKVVIIKKTHLSKNGSSSSSKSSVFRSCQGCTSFLTVLKRGFRIQIRIQDEWIRIRIRNPDPGGQKWPTKV